MQWPREVKCSCGCGGIVYVEPMRDGVIALSVATSAMSRVRHVWLALRGIATAGLVLNDRSASQLIQDIEEAVRSTDES
jgi:hypothetical protein